MNDCRGYNGSRGEQKGNEKCPEILVFPTDNFCKFVAFAVPEILRSSKIQMQVT